MALTINEDQYRAIRTKVLEQRALRTAMQVNESQETDRQFKSVDELMEHLDTLT